MYYVENTVFLLEGTILNNYLQSTKKNSKSKASEVKKSMTVKIDYSRQWHQAKEMRQFMTNTDIKLLPLSG